MAAILASFLPSKEQVWRKPSEGEVGPEAGPFCCHEDSEPFSVDFSGSRRAGGQQTLSIVKGKGQQC